MPSDLEGRLETLSRRETASRGQAMNRIKGSDMENVPIKCPKCGKESVITAGEGHTGILKCDCGATISLKGRPLDFLAELKKIIPDLITQWKAEKRPGVESGLDQAIHESSKKIAMELLETDPDLKSALRQFVEDSLKQAFLNRDEDQV
jgi:hypothetical protein